MLGLMGVKCLVRIQFYENRCCVCEHITEPTPQRIPDSTIFILQMYFY